MFFYKKKLFNIKNMIKIGIFLFILIGITSVLLRKNVKCQEGLELYEDHGEKGFTADEKEQLKDENDKGKGFQINDHKKNNVSDFNLKTEAGNSEIKGYLSSKTEAGLKKMHDALVANTTAAKNEIQKALTNLNKNSTIGKYFKEINKNIKVSISMIDDILLQMANIYPSPNTIALYTDLTELRPELNGVLYSYYLSSSKITSDMITDIGLNTFIIYINTILSTKLKTIQPKLKSFYSLSNENTSDKNKEFLDKLRELDTIINKINSLIVLIKVEDVSKIETTKKDKMLIVNINQYLDNEVIQPEKREKYPNAKW